MPSRAGRKRRYLNEEQQRKGLPEVQFDLNGSLGRAAVPGGLKDTAEYVCHARAGLLPGVTSVKSHHGMGNQVNGLGLVGKAFIEQFTFLEVKSKRKNADRMFNAPILQNYVGSR